MGYYVQTNAHQEEEKGEQNEAEDDPATPRAERAVRASATTKGVVIAPVHCVNI
jgi:hypothetical protein